MLPCYFIRIYQRWFGPPDIWMFPQPNFCAKMQSMRRLTIAVLAMLVLYGCFQIVSFLRVPSAKVIQPIVHVNEEKNLCSFTIIMPTIARGNDKSFEYLRRTVSNLISVSKRSFDPCIRIFHVRDQDAQASANLKATIAPFLKNKVYVHGINKVPNANNRFALSGVKPGEAQQTDDIFDMLSLSHQYCPANGLFLIMEDDFELCKYAEFQLSHVLDEAYRLRGQFSGFRVSTGLNGILIPCEDIPLLLQYMLNNVMTRLPVDWLLENWWNMNNLLNTFFIYYAHANFTGTEHQRQFFIYKYQLFHHIGTSSTMQHVWYIPHATCNEMLIYTELGREYDVQNCAHSLFSPCPTSKAYSIPHNEPDMFRLPTFHSQHTLDELRKVSAEQCNSDCNACCQNVNKTCKPEFLPYVNRCDAVQNTTGCRIEELIISCAPKIKSNELYTISRYSRFFCHAVPKPDELRVCPCA